MLAPIGTGGLAKQVPMLALALALGAIANSRNMGGGKPNSKIKFQSHGNKGPVRQILAAALHVGIGGLAKQLLQLLVTSTVTVLLRTGAIASGSRINCASTTSNTRLRQVVVEQM